MFWTKLNSKLHLLDQHDFYPNGGLKEDHGLQLSSILELVVVQIDYFLSNYLWILICEVKLRQELTHMLQVHLLP